jgi:PilZ domain
MVASLERRKRKRIALHWPVRLYRDQDSPRIESTTENLSSNGFFCASTEPFQLGEQLQCVIAIPAGAFGYSDAHVRLQCRVRVIRIENQRDSYGLGCCIEDYELLKNTPSELQRALTAGPHS